MLCYKRKQPRQLVLPGLFAQNPPSLSLSDKRGFRRVCLTLKCLALTALLDLAKAVIQRNGSTGYAEVYVDWQFRSNTYNQRILGN